MGAAMIPAGYRGLIFLRGAASLMSKAKNTKIGLNLAFGTFYGLKTWLLLLAAPTSLKETNGVACIVGMGQRLHGRVENVIGFGMGQE